MKEHTDDTTPVDELHGQREVDSPATAGVIAGDGCQESGLPLINRHQVHTNPDIPRIISHFDQLKFVAKISPTILCHGLEGAFGTAKTLRKELNGRYQWLRTFPGTAIFCSRYSNRHGWCWVSMPGSEGYLSLLGHIAAESNIHFRLQFVELAFDFPFPNLTYRQVEIILRRVAHRLAVKHGRGIRVTSCSGSEFQECSDDALNGKYTFYLHSLNQDLLRRLAYKRPGRYIAAKNKVYAKKLNDVWHIRVEITIRRAALKSNIPFLTRWYERLTMLLGNRLKFHDFYEFKTMDYAAFKAKVLDIAKTSAIQKKRRMSMISPKLTQMLNEADGLPFHEQRHHMKTIAKHVGSKRLLANLKQFEQTMTLQEALYTPLPDEIKDNLTHDASDEFWNDEIPVELT